MYTVYTFMERDATKGCWRWELEYRLGIDSTYHFASPINKGNVSTDA